MLKFKQKAMLLSLPILSAGMMLGCTTNPDIRYNPHYAHYYQDAAGRYYYEGKDGRYYYVNAAPRPVSSSLASVVKSRISADNELNSQPITVYSYNNGRVELNGFVQNQFQKEKAIDIARSVRGVKSVTDALIIKR